MTDVNPNVDGLLLTRDLMFTSKVTSTAAALGFRVETVGSIDSLASKVSVGSPRAIFLDLACVDFDPRAVIAALGVQRPKVIAFGSHVDVARLDSARNAGCDDVMPRSKFSATLPDLLRELFDIGS